MPQVTARIKIKNKHYEILVNLDEALALKAGRGDVQSAVVTPVVFTDIKKGLHSAKADLLSAFATDNVYEIAKKIILSGEVQKTQEFRDAEREARINQLIHLVVSNAVDQHGRPYTEERLRRALEEVRFHVDNRPPEQQLPQAIENLKNVLPIHLETKRIRLTIPPQYTGQVYGLLKDYKESEDWLSNGSLQVVLHIPAGMQIDFYDKLNNITHGTVQSEDISPPQ